MRYLYLVLLLTTSCGSNPLEGDLGPRGRPGDSTKGDKGDTVVGPKGDPGESIKGDIGDRGYTGAQGPAGEAGYQGSTGPQGDSPEPCFTSDSLVKTKPHHDHIDHYYDVTLVCPTSSSIIARKIKYHSPL